MLVFSAFQCTVEGMFCLHRSNDVNTGAYPLQRRLLLWHNWTGLWLDLSSWFYANRWPYPVCLKALMTLGTTLMMHPRDLSCNLLHVFCWFLAVCLAASTQWPGPPDANTEENGHECTLEPLMSFKLVKVTMRTCTVAIYLAVTPPDVTDRSTLMCLRAVVTRDWWWSDLLFLSMM